MLDFDLAELYDVETKWLKESVKRNIERFPHDFMFELTKNEFEILRWHKVYAISSGQYLQHTFFNNNFNLIKVRKPLKFFAYKLEEIAFGFVRTALRKV